MHTEISKQFKGDTGRTVIAYTQFHKEISKFSYLNNLQKLGWQPGFGAS